MPPSRKAKDLAMTRMSEIFDGNDVCQHSLQVEQKKSSKRPTVVDEEYSSKKSRSDSEKITVEIVFGLLSVKTNKLTTICPEMFIQAAAALCKLSEDTV